MAKVYVVTMGEYSDYGIEAIFSTKERAEQYVKMITGSWDTARVEEHPLDPEKEILKRGYGYWGVRMYRDGKVRGAWVEEEKPSGFDPDRAEIRKSASLLGGHEAWILCNMKARDLDHAVKIANERRTAILAAHQWPDDPPTEE